VIGIARYWRWGGMVQDVFPAGKGLAMSDEMYRVEVD
jgi:hypothetical protein